MIWTRPASTPRAWVRVVCAVAALAAALCGVLLVGASVAPGAGSSMPMDTTSASASRTAVTALGADVVTALGCDGTCTDMPSACVVAPLAASGLLVLLGLQRTRSLGLAPRPARSLTSGRPRPEPPPWAVLTTTRLCVMRV